MNDLTLARDPQVYAPAEDSWLLAGTLEVQYRQATTGSPLRGAVLEIGSGSGVVALTLARAGARVTATDLNPAALALAWRNAAANGLTVELLAGNMFEPIAGRRFDAVVCNPPYLPPGEAYDDPALARAVEGGPTGAEFSARLLAAAPAHLRPGGAVWLLRSSRAGPLPEAGWRRTVIAEERHFFERLCVERWERT